MDRYTELIDKREELSIKYTRLFNGNDYEVIQSVGVLSELKVVTDELTAIDKALSQSTSGGGNYKSN